MTAMTNETKPGHEKREAFLKALASSLEAGAFLELRLAKYRGDEPELNRILVRRILLQGQSSLSFVYRYKTRDITKNHPIDKGLAAIADRLGTDFKAAHLFTTDEDLQIEFTKKGKAKLGRSRPSRKAPATNASHDRAKHRYVDPERPYLRALGVTHDGGRIVPAMARKWKQINKFVEIFDHALSSSDLGGKTSLHVVDFGSGKGYLTFAVYDYLQTEREIDTRVTGVELRENLVGLCDGVAEQLGMEGLTFRKGDVRTSPPEAMDALIALHACDTATDLAIHLGIRSNAGIIMCAPCCHKEIRKQIESPEILRPMLKFGVHLGQEADMVTDALRALLLEAHGYRVQILEFVSLEHTRKNKLILAIRGATSEPRQDAYQEIKRLKTFYGIREQALETLLRRSA